MYSVVERFSWGRPGNEAGQRVLTINRCLLSVGVVRFTKSAHDGSKCFHIKFAQCGLTNKNPKLFKETTGIENGEVNFCFSHAHQQPHLSRVH